MRRNIVPIDKLKELKHPEILYTEGLPILERKEEILSAILHNQVVIVAGETGSGKTTQLPVICLEAGRGVYRKIGCTQPRRIAAVSIANRVAEQLHCSLGNEVGYKIRFHDKDSSLTSIKFMTDGILLAEIEQDPLLSTYDTLIIDEAHERSLNIDFILGYLRDLLKKRPDLKLIISSATIDTKLFSHAFNNAPVIEVSGRVYPVELLYLSEEDQENSEETYIDSAVKAAQDLLDLYSFGDMLIFMPTERDIRETCDRLNCLKRHNTVVLPLFSRLSRAEQESIFRKIDKRKVVVATNIAETSVTVPDIKFVIDSGLARISRYVPRLRTNRLPIETVSKAAADQRKGRCGRVMDGVCIRLFSEKNYLQRDDFTLPEIKRANLAGVILSMMAHHLGDIEEFPFLEPPSRNAISEGYALLRELGALDSGNRLTSLGKKIACFPIDPHIARMIIAAREENAIREVLIIAAALSIVDPRERPFDKQAEADQMHRKFIVPGSDFLSFVKLWDAYWQEWNSLGTQNKMRTFCKEHYLSFARMQEWHDVYQLLFEIVTKMKGFTLNNQPASADAIHRSLLTGLLSNCACKTDTGKFRALRGKEVVIFPGSSLSGQKPQWIVCHEVVETSQLFAHTIAPVNPSWLEQLGAHLCTRSYSEPYFDIETGVVRAIEKVSLYGMQIAEHSGICFGKIDSKKATEVFIRQALVEELLNGEYRFYKHNKSVRKEIELMEEKLRSRSLFAGEIAIEQFYSSRLSNVSSIHDLNRIIKDNGGDDFLFINKDDILVTDIPQSVENFPDKVSIGGKNFPLNYAFKPGSENDGITLSIPLKEASYIPESVLGYLVPALWTDVILELLRNLPKQLRKKLMPLNEKASEISKTIKLSALPFEVNLSKTLNDLYGIDIPSEMLILSRLPSHLVLRVEIMGKDGDVLKAGRGKDVLKNEYREESEQIETSWDNAFCQYEKKGLTDWTIDSIPEHIEIIISKKSMPLYGYPALKDAENSVDLILCKSSSEAAKIHLHGVRKLLEICLSQELAWIDRELKFPQQLKLLCSSIGGADIIKKNTFFSIKKYLFGIKKDELPYDKKQFDSIINNIKSQSKSISYEAISLLEKTIVMFNENCMLIKREKCHTDLKKELMEDMAFYLNELKSEFVFQRLRQFPRYLEAFSFRIQRAFLEPVKYRRKRLELAVFFDKLNGYYINVNDYDLYYEIENFRGMIEEYAISLFAQQEVKTLYPVSAQRLEKKVVQLNVQNAGGKKIK